MMKVVWFKMAVRDLESLKGYITQDNPQTAQKIVLGIKDKISLFSEQPGMGRPGRVPNTKELVIDHTPYILPYRVRDNRIEILRVLHVTRRWPQKF